MAKQKMIAPEGQEMIPSDEMEKAEAPAQKKHSGKKAKVNMTLPAGSHLVQGEVAELNAEDEAFLEKHHGHHIEHILE